MINVENFQIPVKKTPKKPWINQEKPVFHYINASGYKELNQDIRNRFRPRLTMDELEMCYKFGMYKKFKAILKRKSNCPAYLKILAFIITAGVSLKYVKFSAAKIAKTLGVSIKSVYRFEEDGFIKKISGKKTYDANEYIIDPIFKDPMFVNIVRDLFGSIKVFLLKKCPTIPKRIILCFICKMREYIKDGIFWVNFEDFSTTDVQGKNGNPKSEESCLKEPESDIMCSGVVHMSAQELSKYGPVSQAERVAMRSKISAHFNKGLK